MEPRCEQACCWEANIYLLLYCPCGALRGYGSMVLLCNPDTEVFQPCRDQSCVHCFEFSCYFSGSEDDLSEERLSEEEEEDSGFEEMD